MGRALVIALTGSSGFVGRAMCDRLHAIGHSVRRVPHRLPNDGGAALRAHLAGVHAVVHLAALAHRTSADRPTEDAYREANALFAERVAAASRSCGAARFIFMSSIAVHGSPARMPVDESTPVAPANAYGRSKALGEELVRRAFDGGEWVILRPPVVHGPGQPGNLARLANAIDRGLPVPDFGEGVRRSTMALDNLVDATVCALTHPGAARRTWTLADGPAMTIRALATIAAESRGRRARIIRVPSVALLAAGAVARAMSVAGWQLGDTVAEDLRRLGSGFEVDGSRFAGELGWVPPVEPEHGLRRAFAH